MNETPVLIFNIQKRAFKTRVRSFPLKDCVLYKAAKNSDTVSVELYRAVKSLNPHVTNVFY